MKTNNNKKLRNKIYKLICILLLISSSFFLFEILYINMLPFKYFLIILLVVTFFTLFNIVFINLPRLKLKVKNIMAIIMIFATVLISSLNFFISKTLGVLWSNSGSKYKTVHYSVLVLDNSDYDKIKDVESKEIGYFNSSVNSVLAVESLRKEIDFNLISYQESDRLVQDLLSSKIDAIVLEESIIQILNEEIETFEDNVKTIYSFSTKIKIESILKDVDVVNQPFSIYISGIDTYGEISSVSRSDVNILMVVNPKTHQILLISIPRDYYVQLHNTTGNKDKLTHAGIYGIDMSIKTVEDLLKTNINYYIKVNFTSVIDIIDALGGIELYSEYSFIAYSGYSFSKKSAGIDKSCNKKNN